jgi:hypothetical protein
MSSRPLLLLLVVLAASCTGAIERPEHETGNPWGSGAPSSQPGQGPASGPGASPGSQPGPGNVVPRPPAGRFRGPIVSQPSASSRFVRLSHRQWENTVRDALRLSALPGLSSAFVAEPLRGTFDTNGSILSVSPDLFGDYQTAAEALAAKVAKDAKQLAALAPPSSGALRVRAEALIQELGLRAFRRPLAAAEVERILALFERGPMLIGSGDAFADGAELVLSYFFQSPHFVYRTELSSAVIDGKIALNPYEVATRLSYGLTNTMPDDALFAAAAADELRTREGVLSHAERLLGLPGARDTVADFHQQLLNMREYEVVSKDEARYPEFASGVADDLKQEAVSFVHDVVFAQERGLHELLTAPYTFANQRIAALYGLAPAARPGSAADAFVRVELDPLQRAGLLTQVGFLAANGEGATPNIIMRGVHVARKILCADLPPPPAMIPPLPALSATSTNRQRVEELTKGSPCNGCHTSIINPLGFALEKLDGVGRYRTQENGRAIDATSSYQLDGQSVSFDGAVELSALIAGSQQAHDCYSRHWVEYLYGREVDMASAADRSLVEQAGSLSNGDSSAKELIVNLVATDAFVTRLP